MSLVVVITHAIIRPMGKASRKKKGSIHKAQYNQGNVEKDLEFSQKEPLKGSPRKTSSIIKFIPILILLLISFAVYFNALFGDFVYDDMYQIVQNQWIRDIANIPEIFTKNVWSYHPGVHTSNYYRPMMHIIFMYNYHVFGLKPWGFHLVNILFHCGVSVFVFLILGKLLTEQSIKTSSVYLSAPFIAAMLFASHPIHTEAVTWIAGLPDVAFTFFYLLSFYFYILFRAGIKKRYTFSILSFTVAALFKEPALTLPIMLIVYDYITKKSGETIFIGVRRYIPYIVISGAYLLVRYYALRSIAPLEEYTALSTYQLVINIFPLFREYLTSLFWPFGLNLWHTFHPITSLVEGKAMLSIVVTAIFFICTAVAYRKNTLLFFSLLLIAVPLVPVFYIKVIMGKPFAERYLYLPSVGFVFLVAYFLSWTKLTLAGKARSSMILVFIVVFGLYVIGTISRNSVWQNNISLWSDTLKRAPDSEEAHYALGYAYASNAEWDKAIAQYQIALQMNPDDADTHNNLGLAYESQGQLDKAIAEYQAATRLNPDDAEAHNNLALRYASHGQLDRAIAEYQQAIQLKPDYAEIYNNLGNAYAAQSQLDQAIAEYQKAIQLKPTYAKAHYNLGNAYAAQSQLDQAIVEYQKAVQLKPDYTDAYNNLGAVYAAKGFFDMAIKEYQNVLRLTPDSVMARYNLASTYLRQGRKDLAKREVELLLNIKPDFDRARQLLNLINSGRY